MKKWKWKKWERLKHEQCKWTRRNKKFAINMKITVAHN